MPKALEQALRKAAEKKGFTGDQKDAYIYGNPAMKKHMAKKKMMK